MAVSKPLPGQQISPDNPWARRLVNAVVANQAGQRVINHAPNFNGIDGLGTALRFAGSPGGGAIKTNGTTAFVNFGNQPRMRGTGPVTVAFRLKLNTLTVANLPMVYSVGYDGADVGLYIGFNANSAGNGKLWWICGGAATPYRGGYTNTDFSTFVGVYVDVLCEYNGAAYNIDVNGVSNYTNNNSGARVANGRNATLGSIDLSGSNTRFGDFDLEYLYHWEGRTFTAAEKAALRANPWLLWDDPQLVFAPVTGTTITAAWTEADDTVAVTESSSNAANLAWTEGNDTAAISETSSASASISWAEADDIAAAAITAASQSSLAWLEESDTIAINVLSGDATAVSDWIITARRRGRR